MKNQVLTFILLVGLSVFPIQGLTQTLLNVDASGSHGIDGADGLRGSNSGYSDGGDATDADDGTDADDAGDINIQIKEGKTQRGAIVVRGTYDGKSLNKSVEFGNSGYIFLDASGGDGGDGGDGKKGGRGCDGDDGIDGTDGWVSNFITFETPEVSKIGLTF